MVGVAGRSKACITCRRRRKGCGLEKPACARCRKAGLACEGYDTDRIFVVSDPSGRYNASQAARSSARSADRHQVHLSSGIANLRLLTQPAYESRCIDLFWEAYFPSGRPLPESLSRSYMCSWTETAQKLYTQDDSLRYALWANCLLMTGRRYHDAWMLREGPRMYGKALAGLRSSLSISGRVRRDTLIATVKLLTMFEAFSQQGGGQTAADQSQSWQRHHAGELALFLARTPVAHVNGDAHHIFADERVEMALSAMLRRKKLALSTPEWKSIPWREIPKNLKDVLVDVLVDMPGIVEDFDTMRCCADASRQAALRRELVRKCWELDGQLMHWFGSVCRLGDPAEHGLTEAAARDLVTHVARMHAMALFWTICLVLYSILRVASGPQAGLPKRMDPLLYARRLVEVIPILLEPSAGLYGQQSAVLPLEVALQYTVTIGSLSQEIEELVEMLRTIKHGLGGALSRTISEVPPDEAESGKVTSEISPLKGPKKQPSVGRP